MSIIVAFILNLQSSWTKAFRRLESVVRRFLYGIDTVDFLLRDFQTLKISLCRKVDILFWQVSEIVLSIPRLIDTNYAPRTRVKPVVTTMVR